MPSEPVRTTTVVGRRMRSRRADLGWSLEQLGVMIGIDESSSRARISRYELGVHEPPVATARLLAEALKVPLPYLYCEDDDIAALLLGLNDLPKSLRKEKVRQFGSMLPPHQALE